MNVVTNSPIADSGSRDPLAAASAKLFPPLRNRALVEVAGALAENKNEIAEGLVRRFLEKKPQEPDALNLLATVARRAKRFEDAEALMRQCVERSPQTIGFRYNYAIALRYQLKYEQALAEIDNVLAHDPGNPLVRDQKATILTVAGRHAEALVCRRALTEQYPLWADGWHRYGSVLRDNGMQSQCISAYHKALELDPGLAVCYSNLAGLKVYRFTPGEIEQMERLLRTPGLPSDARVNMHHALGKAYGDAKNFAKSFENYAKGNALDRIGVPFDSERFRAQRQACEEGFTNAFFRERAGWGCPSRDPIFIVGLPRSGSTLIEQILSSHSAIEGLGELGDLDSVLAGALSDKREQLGLEQLGNKNAVEKSALAVAYLRHLSSFTGEDFRAIGQAYLNVTAVRRKTNRPFFTDKTLRNFFYLGLIQLMLPNAKIIDTRRHPLDCGWSCFKSQFPGGHFYALRLSDIGADYVNYVRLMALFDRVLPGRIYRVFHEKLVDDPETELRGLFDYLELPFEEQCLRFYENDRAVYTQSSEQVRQPLNKSGMAQWVPYEPWLGPLKNALGPVLDSYPRVPE